MATYYRYGKEWERKDKTLTNNASLNIKMPKSDLDKLREIAKDNNINYSKIVRKLIKDYNNGLIKIDI